MYNWNEEILTRLEFKDQDALPLETLWESYMLIYHNGYSHFGGLENSETIVKLTMLS